MSEKIKSKLYELYDLLLKTPGYKDCRLDTEVCGYKFSTWDHKDIGAGLTISIDGRGFNESMIETKLDNFILDKVMEDINQKKGEDGDD